MASEHTVPNLLSTVEATPEYRLATSAPGNGSVCLQRKYVISSFAWDGKLLMFVKTKTDEWRSIPTVVI